MLASVVLHEDPRYRRSGSTNVFYRHFMRFLILSWIELTQEENYCVSNFAGQPPVAYSEWPISLMSSMTPRTRSNEWQSNLQRWPFTILRRIPGPNGADREETAYS